MDGSDSIFEGIADSDIEASQQVILGQLGLLEKVLCVVEEDTYRKQEYWMRIWTFYSKENPKKIQIALTTRIGVCIPNDDAAFNIVWERQANLDSFR